MFFNAFRFKIIQRYTLIFLFTVSFFFAQSQQLSTKGKDFWMGFMNNGGSVNINGLSIYISSTVNTSGTISIPGLSWSTAFTVLANSTSQIQIPSTANVLSSGVIENKGIHITSLDTISVFALNYKPATSDASIIYPTNTLDREYRVLTIQGWPYHTGEEYLIVATENNTTIEITPYGGIPFIISLNAGQVYQVISSPSVQLSGAVIKEFNCHKIAVFSGSLCDNIGGCSACDHLFEQLLPVSRFGENFITTPLMNKAQDYFRIIAHYNGTAVTLNGGLPVVLNAGQVHQFNTNQPTFIQSTMPVFVYQYAQGVNCDGVGDPFSLIVPPMEQAIGDITFNAFTSSIITSYFVNIVTPTTYSASLTLDGTPVIFNTVTANPFYSYARIAISSGNHRILSPNKFTASVYGFGQAESYGYSAGFSLNNLQYSFTATPDSVCIGVPVIFSAQYYANISNYKWLFGDGSMGNGLNISHIYNSGNNFTVGLILTDNTSCNDTIWKTIHILPPYHSNIYPVICQGDTFLIGTHQLTVSGVYSDTLTSISGCDSIITTNLTVNPNKEDSISFQICEGEIFTIGNHNYSISGNYIDTLTTYLCCDSIIHSHLTVNPLIQTIINPKICQGEIFKVGSHIYVLSGNFIDTLSSYLACDSIVTTNLTVLEFPLVNLGENKEICDGESFELIVDNSYSSYLWQDNSINNSFQVSQPGKYWVKVTNEICIKTDTILFTLCKQTINVWIPNSFTPNGDGLNDVFKIETNGEYYKFQLYIYNRWGGLVFESTNATNGWDGKYNGVEALPGVYNFNLNFIGKDSSQEKQLNGKLTLIR
ncbi:MAG: gliding motility-associated C-terminal domain-containing protein [Bacteroidales bacterium]